MQIMSAGTWRKRGALKLKRKYDHLKRELNASRHPVMTMQTVRTERATAVVTIPEGILTDGAELPWFLRHVLAEKIADALLDTDAVRFEREGLCYGKPAIRAELNFVRR